LVWLADTSSSEYQGQKWLLREINRRHFVFPEKERMKFGLAASSVAGQTMQLVGAEDAFTVSIMLCILSTYSRLSRTFFSIS
jgi:hypothetical protein